MKILNKWHNREFKKTQKLQRNASLKLESWTEIYSRKYHSLDKLIIYKKLMSYLKVKEKDYNYTGAKIIPISFISGILIFLTTSFLLDVNDPNSAASILNNFSSQILDASTKFGFKVLMIIVLYSLVFVIFIFPVLVLVILTIIGLDRRKRKNYIENSIMIELLQEKIDNYRQSN